MKASLSKGTTHCTQTISTFNRDYTILVKDVSVTTDLSLRNYIYQVNYNNLTQTRVPNVENENGIISYKHTKVPVEANTGDLITFKVISLLVYPLNIKAFSNALKIN